MRPYLHTTALLRKNQRPNYSLGLPKSLRKIFSSNSAPREEYLQYTIWHELKQQATRVLASPTDRCNSLVHIRDNTARDLMTILSPPRDLRQCFLQKLMTQLTGIMVYGSLSVNEPNQGQTVFFTADCLIA